MYFSCFGTKKILSIYLIDIILCSWMCNICGAREAVSRAIGGRDAHAGEFPYVVSIEARLQPVPPATGSTRHYHACTASALSATMSLTAAHCCFPLRRQLHVKTRNKTVTELELSMVIRYGSDTGRSSDDDRYSDILRCLQPPSARHWNDMTMLNEIALLASHPMLLSAYARLSAVDQHALYGQRVLVLGYGLTNGSDGELESARQLKKPLQVVDVMWTRCEEPEVFITYPLACGVETCGRHAAICPGDSGGPALYDSKIVGVAAKAPAKNCQAKSDGMYYGSIVYMMPVSSHMDWIANTMAEAPKFL